MLFRSINYFEPALDEAGIPVHKYTKKGRFDLSLVMYIRKLILQHQFDAVLAFMLTPSLYAELACWSLAKSKRPTLCFSDRSTFEDGFTPSLLFRLRHQTHRVATVITTNSASHKKKLTDLFPWMEDKAQEVYNGVDTSLLTGGEARPFEAPYLLSVSRVIGYKNFVKLAEALVICANKGVEIPTVLWLGKVFERTDVEEQMAYVKRILSEAKIEHKLQFLGETRDVGTYYRHADALIHPSLIEGFSNAVAEGMCWGLPCLLGNISDHEKIVSQHANGKIFDVNQAESIAEAMIWYAQCSEQQKQQMRDNSKNASLELFAMDKAANTYKALLAL